MNKLLAKRLVLTPNKLLISMNRWVTYEVLPTGEKVVVNKVEGKSSKKEKWQRVRPMGYEPQLRMIKQIEFDHRLETDPKKARETASARLRSLRDSLRNRGFCRETKPYNPPKNIDNIIEDICVKVFANESNVQNWSNIALSDRIIKYKFLTQCSKELNYEIPNSMLYLMKTVSDVHQFYSTPIRGISSYDEMFKNSDNLPQNLHLIGEPIRYNPENDPFFGGINAYPFSTYRVAGLRAKKKYPIYKSHFVWPDV